MKRVIHRDVTCKVVFLNPERNTSSPYRLGASYITPCYITPCPVCYRAIMEEDRVRLAHKECWDNLNSNQRTYLTSLLRMALSKDTNSNLYTQIRGGCVFVTYSLEVLWKLETY